MLRKEGIIMKGKDTVNRSPVSSEDFRFLIDDSETY